MKCLICDKNSENSVCADCENRKKCKECNLLKFDFYTYRNGSVYIKCIECFNKKINGEFCSREFNRTYLSKHIKRLHTSELDKNKFINYMNNSNDKNYNSNKNIIKNLYDININFSNDTASLALHNINDRTLIVGPSFSGDFFAVE